MSTPYQWAALRANATGLMCIAIFIAGSPEEAIEWLSWVRRRCDALIVAVRANDPVSMALITDSTQGLPHDEN